METSEQQLALLDIFSFSSLAKIFGGKLFKKILVDNETIFLNEITVSVGQIYIS